MSVEAAFTYSSHTWLHVLSRSAGRDIIPLILTLQCQLVSVRENGGRNPVSSPLEAHTTSSAERYISETRENIGPEFFRRMCEAVHRQNTGRDNILAMSVARHSSASEASNGNATGKSLLIQTLTGTSHFQIEGDDHAK
jgi:hypothetical protein